MPMFKALQLCPEAVVVKTNGIRGLTQHASRDHLAPMMEEPDPANRGLCRWTTRRFLGPARARSCICIGAPPAVMLAGLVRRTGTRAGRPRAREAVSHDKISMAKIASDLDKPRGFSVISKADTESFFYAGKAPVGIIWGVGAAMRAQLERAGITTIDDLLRWDRTDLVARFGSMGMRLYDLARGQDARPVSRDRAVKSISKETTFGADLADPEVLEGPFVAAGRAGLQPCQGARSGGAGCHAKAENAPTIAA